jgi:arylsulfatase
MDLVPTFLELADTHYPATWKGKAVVPPMGRSLVPLLAKKSASVRGPDDAIGWEFGNLKALRMGRYKATWIPKPYGPGRWQLFDLSVDPGEHDDLAAQKPKVMKRLEKQWEEYAQSVGVIPGGKELH